MPQEQQTTSRLPFRDGRRRATPAAPSPDERTSRRARALFGLAILLPLSLYFAFASRLITARVGYEMDEALYVESAVFLLRGSGAPPFIYEPASWITAFGRSWPLMIIPYVGAAKAYVALPLFAAFGISGEIARWSGVLLGGLGIAGLVTLIGRQIHPAAAFLTGIFLGIHPSYLDFTVFDNGGASVWMAAMGLGALALDAHLRRRSARSALFLGVAGGLGVWARANFLWLLAALIAAALVAFGRRAIPRRSHIAAMLIGGCIGALPLVLYEAASRLGTLRFIAANRQPLSGSVLAQRIRALAELMISDREQRVIWGGPPAPLWQVGIGAALLVLVLGCLFYPVDPSHPAISRWRRAFATATAALTVLLLASRLGIQQHHLVAVLPLALAALAILGVEIVGRARRALLPLGALAAGLAVLCLSWDFRIDRGLRQTGGRRAFSSAIDEVAKYLESHPVPADRLKILNWGFQNSLYVVSGSSVHGSELFWGATKDISRRGMTWQSEIRDGGSFLLFLFPMGPPSLSDGADGFSAALADYGGPRREKVFYERSGVPCARLIEIPPTR